MWHIDGQAKNMSIARQRQREAGEESIINGTRLCRILAK